MPVEKKSMPYEDRCCYGQGWEDARANKPGDDCHYEIGSFRREQWMSGYRDFSSGKYANLREKSR